MSWRILYLSIKHESQQWSWKRTYYKRILLYLIDEILKLIRFRWSSKLQSEVIRQTWQRCRKISLGSGGFQMCRIFSRQLQAFKTWKHKKLHAASMWNLLDDFWSEFRAYSVIKSSKNSFLSNQRIAFFCSFSLFLCTIALNYGIFDPALLFNSMSSLRPLHLLQVCQSNSKAPCMRI